jgi:hypothetical protein
MGKPQMFQSHVAPRAANDGPGEIERALVEAVRTIQLLQAQLRQSQQLVLDLRGQLNRAARRD